MSADKECTSSDVPLAHRGYAGLLPQQRAGEGAEEYWSKAHRLANDLRKHLTTMPVPPRYLFSRFDRLLDDLGEWRNKDHEDNKVLSRNDIIEIIEGVKALRMERP